MRKNLGVLGLIVLLSASFAQAQDLPIGIIKTIKGMVYLDRNNQTLTPKEGERFFANDSFRTGPDGAIGIVFKDNTLVSLGPNSALGIKEFLFSPGEGKLSIITRLLKGTAVYLTGIIGKLSPESVRFETPVGNIGIRGTRFAVKVVETETKE